jgi:Fe-Mn family superoxide dismutase
LAKGLYTPVVHSDTGGKQATAGRSLTQEKNMENSRLYVLPELPYAYAALAPQISEEQLRLHHQKHHQAYVNGANALFEKLDKARKENSDLDMKASLKELSFHIGGFKLHNTFWENLAPAGKGGGGAPREELAKAIDSNFGSFDRFRKEFTQAAAGAEGSGWAVLTFCNKTRRLLIMQVEKHNVNVMPGYDILLVLDVWEHAYYLDYRNDRAKFIEAFWNIVNWDAVARRFAKGRK